MKRVSFYLIVVILFSLNLLFILRIANTERIGLSDYYFRKSLSEKDPMKFETNLKTALFLDQTPEKRLKLCNFYLDWSKNQEFLNCLKLINNNEYKTELQRYFEFQNNPTKMNKDDISTKTDYGRLLYAILSGNYRDTGQTEIGKSINNLDINLGEQNFRLRVAEIFFEHNSPKIARFVISSTSALPITKIGQNLIIETYKKEKNYEKALDESNLLINMDPSDINSYHKSLELAQKINDQVTIRKRLNQISEIEKLK